MPSSDFDVVTGPPAPIRPALPAPGAARPPVIIEEAPAARRPLPPAPPPVPRAAHR